MKPFPVVVGTAALVIFGMRPAPCQSPAVQPARETVSATPAATREAAKPRVYIGASPAWTVSGGSVGAISGDAGSVGGGSVGVLSGGADPQTVEVIKTFMNKCPQVIVTRNQKNADYFVMFDRDSARRSSGDTGGILLKVNKIAVFSKNGDALFATSTRSVGAAVKDACAAITGPQAR